MQSVLTRSKVGVIQPSGHVNASNAADFRNDLEVAISNPECHALLVDLSQVESLDSAGLVAMVATLTLSQQHDKQFGLCGVSPAIRIIFELTQLDRVFEIFETQRDFQAAIAAGDFGQL